MEAKKKSKAAIESAALGLSGAPRKIYLNQDLPEETRKIYNKARELKNNGFKFVWSKHNNVYCRKTESSNVIRLKSCDQVAEIMAKLRADDNDVEHYSTA